MGIYRLNAINNLEPYLYLRLSIQLCGGLMVRMTTSL